MIDNTHTTELAAKVNYAALGFTPPEPSPLDLDATAGAAERS